MRIVVPLALVAASGCYLLPGPDGPRTACSVVEQAVYEPPQMIEFHVPVDDGGTRVCVPGSDDGCGVLILRDCVVAFAAPVDSEHVVEIGVRNQSVSIDLALHGVEVDGAPFAVEAFPAVVSPDDVAALTIAYRPTAAGTHDAVLDIASDARNVADGRVRLALQGVASPR